MQIVGYFSRNLLLWCPPHRSMSWSLAWWNLPQGFVHQPLDLCTREGCSLNGDGLTRLSKVCLKACHGKQTQTASIHNRQQVLWKVLWNFDSHINLVFSPIAMIMASWNNESLVNLKLLGMAQISWMPWDREGSILEVHTPVSMLQSFWIPWLLYCAYKIVTATKDPYSHLLLLLLRPVDHRFSFPLFPCLSSGKCCKPSFVHNDTPCTDPMDDHVNKGMKYKRSVVPKRKTTEELGWKTWGVKLSRKHCKVKRAMDRKK